MVTSTVSPTLMPSSRWILDLQAHGCPSVPDRHRWHGRVHRHDGDRYRDLLVHPFRLDRWDVASSIP